MATYNAKTTSITFTDANGEKFTVGGVIDGIESCTAEMYRCSEAAKAATEAAQAFTVAMSYTVPMQSFWLHPMFYIDWSKRNPSAGMLRVWWVHHLGRSNRSFRRTSLRQVRRLWREGAWKPIRVWLEGDVLYVETASPGTVDVTTWGVL